MKLDAVRYVSFAGRGPEGMAYLGWMDALEDHLLTMRVTMEDWRTRLRGVAGTSAGSVAL